MRAELQRVSKLLTYFPPLAKEENEELRMTEQDKRALAILLTELKGSGALSAQNKAALGILESLGVDLNVPGSLSEHDEDFLLQFCESSDSIHKQIDQFSDEVFDQCFQIAVSSDSKTIDRSKLDDELKHLKESEKELLEHILRYAFFKDLQGSLKGLHKALKPGSSSTHLLYIQMFKDDPEQLERDTNLIILEPNQREFVSDLLGLVRQSLKSGQSLLDDNLLGHTEMIVLSLRDEVSKAAIDIAKNKAN